MFEITIKQKVKETVQGGKDWAVIEEIPYTKEEYENLDHYYKSRNNDVLLLKQVRGYTPVKETVQVVERELLKQTVETLDLQKVIKAINGIEG